MNHQGTQTLAPRPARDPEARERLLLEHLPQVRYIARRIHDRLPAQVPLEDLIHAGVVGLIDALKSSIEQERAAQVLCEIPNSRGHPGQSSELDWSPRHLRRKARQIEEAHRDLKLRLGRVASEPELGRRTWMNLEEFQHLLGDLRGLDLGSLPDGIHGLEIRRRGDHLQTGRGRQRPIFSVPARRNEVAGGQRAGRPG